MKNVKDYFLSNKADLIMTGFRNAFGFLTLLILGMCYLVYISKYETHSERPSCTVNVYNGLVQREMSTASKFNFLWSFWVEKRSSRGENRLNSKVMYQYLWIISYGR